MSSIMRCRSGLMALSVMRDAPVLMKVANPSSQDRTPRRAIGVGCVVRRGALPRERFSPLALFGLSAMSDLSPLCAPKRTSAERADQGDVRQRDFLCGGNVDRLG
jgi:hypothetical protein